MNRKLVVCIRDLICPTGGPYPLKISRLEICEGEKIAIVGHNGAGKSTLFRLLSGFIKPSAGSAVVLGHTLEQSMPPKKLRNLRLSVGQIMQGLHLVQRITVLDNVLIGNLGRVSGWRSLIRYYNEGEIAAAERALQTVGLLSKANTRTDFLSGGEKQKVAIARLLLQNPRLILADEPTAALDPGAANELCQIIGDVTAQVTLVSILHNPNLIPLLATRVIGLKHGEIVFDLPVEQVDQRCLNQLYELHP